MTLSPAILRAMQAAGASVDIIIAAVEADAAIEAERAERQIPWDKLRVMAFARDGEVCAYCKTTDGPFEVDHVIPRAKGGENILDNVVVACRGCNRAKKDREGHEWEIIHARRERDRIRKREERQARKMSEDVRGQNGRSKDTSPQVSPKDISNPLPNPSVDAEASLSVRIVDAWNEGPARRGATAARALDANRRKALSCRMKEHSEGELFEAISNLAASDWHCGKNERGWTVNLGWLLKSPENFQKALEMGSRAQPHATAAEPINLAQRILQREQQRAQA